ncbi:hypothetical protein A4A49_56849, partial [Nicotiana attenuata]
KFGKGTAKLPRDIPASIALARISNVVNPIVHAYDKLASAASIMASGGVSKSAADCAEEIKTSKKNQIDPISNEVHQKVQNHVENDGLESAISTGPKEAVVLQTVNTVVQASDATVASTAAILKETVARANEYMQFKPNDRGDMGQNSGTKASQIVTEGE